MKRLGLILGLWAALCVPAFAQFNGGGFGQPGFTSPKVAGGGGGCSDTDATAWVTAVVGAGGTVSGTQTTNVCNLIVAYKAAGVFTLLDREWLLASENATQAKVSITPDHSTFTINGTPTFTANSGYTNFSTSNFFDSGVSPGLTAGTNCTQNSCSFGGYIGGGRTSTNNGILMGTASASAFWYLAVLDTGGMDAENFGFSFANGANPFAAANGNYINSRVGSTKLTVYDRAAAGVDVTDTSTAVGTSQTFIIGATHTAAAAISQPLLSPDILQSAFMGQGLTSTQAAAKNAALNTYMTAIGANVY